ncbi:lytic transglycosylase domain-containing protein [Myxococcus stipitatus]|uniref:lytic transglycosylase domain-containing protein n=1 Tax=Myxococcus stipitatus TaxID=83455 RepID=UPI0030D0754E
MRGLTVAVAAAAMLIGGGVSAFPAQVPMESLGEPAEMTQLRVRLAQAEAELSLARMKLQAYEDEAMYGEAERLGVAEHVKASGLPEHQQRRLSVAILREAQRNNVDPMLVVAVIRCESSFNNYAVSHVGAMGLMQVMPETGTWLADKAGFELGRKTNLFDAETNVALGTAYLAELIERFGTVEKALVAYNAGPGQARRILAKKEARSRFIAGYPTKVVKEFRKLKAQQARALTAVEQQKTAGREG